MRSKEDAIDYRYFTEPNLPKILLDKKWIDEIKKELPILPYERYKKYSSEYSITEKDAYTIIRDKKLSDFYEECIKLSDNYLIISNWLTGDVMKNLNRVGVDINESLITPKMLVDLIKMIEDGKINGKQGKEVLEKIIDTGKEPSVIVEELGITQIGGEDEIREIVLSVIEENSNLVDDYKNGKRVFDYFIGQIMKKTRGRANPVITSKILKEELDKYL